MEGEAAAEGGEVAGGEATVHKEIQDLRVGEADFGEVAVQKFGDAFGAQGVELDGFVEAAHDGAVQGCNCIGGAKEDTPEIFHAGEEFVNEGPLPASGGVFARREKGVGFVEEEDAPGFFFFYVELLSNTIVFPSQTTILSIRRRIKLPII